MIPQTVQLAILIGGLGRATVNLSKKGRKVKE
jgi:hypothetical protein